MIQENQYFEGNVKSLGYTNGEQKSTVGVINPGEYEFGTANKELMIIVEGTLSALLPNDKDWKHFSAGDKFEVEANATFKVRVVEQVSYFCKYFR